MELNKKLTDYLHNNNAKMEVMCMDYFEMKY